MSERLVMESSVEALFVRALGAKIRNSRECLDALQAAGIDPTQRLKPSYPAEVYEQGMVIVRKHLWASEPDDHRAYWSIGRETTEGFYRTLVGGAIGGVLKLLSPERMLPRLPRNIVSSTNYMKANVEQKAPKHFELYVYGSNHPAFVGGAVERGVEQTGAKVKVEIIRSGQYEHWFSITW